MSNNVVDIHMSDLDEETKRILAEVDTDDSKDKSKKDKPKPDEIVNTRWETNSEDADDSEW